MNRLKSTKIAVHDVNLSWAERLAEKEGKTVKEILKWAVVKGLGLMAKEIEIREERVQMDKEQDQAIQRRIS